MHDESGGKLVSCSGKRVVASAACRIDTWEYNIPDPHQLLPCHVSGTLLPLSASLGIIMHILS